MFFCAVHGGCNVAPAACLPTLALAGYDKPPEPLLGVMGLDGLVAFRHSIKPTIA